MWCFEKKFSPKCCQINFRKSHKASRRSDKKWKIGRQKKIEWEGILAAPGIDKVKQQRKITLKFLYQNVFFYFKYT